MQEVKLSSRVKFPCTGQRQFIEEALSALKTHTSGLAKAVHVSDRTVRDWKREKNNIDFTSLFLICKKVGINFPKNIKVLEPYWSTKKASKLGGKRYVALYGAPGTIESRRKGGINTQKKFRENPEYAEKVKFFIRKQINYPPKSEIFAEFIGIMLGDGGISNPYQITISFNGKEDSAYAFYIQKMVKNLFNISSTRRLRKEMGNADILVTSISLVEYLQTMGIRKGNKVKNQVDIPHWILERKSYQSGCLRGLFDTDGCVYKHNYRVNGKLYSYLKMSFRNYSIPLLSSVKKMLENLGFHPVIDIKHQTVYINRAEEVKKYFSDVGTGNPRYLKKFNKFSKE